MMAHPLEQHDELYRKAFEKFRESKLDQARALAEAAAEQAQRYLLQEGLAVPVDHYTCRAQALLRLIDEKSSHHNAP